MTDIKDDGGPAFPHDGRDNGPGNIKGRPHDGMTLRDWFAGQALAAIIAKHPAMGNEVAPDIGVTVMSFGDADLIYRAMANGAYRYADAMLEARK